jgi:hypothetical protein
MKHSYLLTMTACALISACGGGGGGGSTASTPQTQTIAGIATDGYLKDATVCLDVNDNGICDPTEPTTTTKDQGAYALDIPSSEAEKHKLILVAEAGITSDADRPNQTLTKGYVLTTTKDNPNIISPLTTMVVAAMEKDNIPTIDAAKQVLRALNLSNDSKLSTSDLFKDFSSSQNQQSNDSLVKLANSAKFITNVISNAVATSAESDTAIDVLKLAAAPTAISQSIQASNADNLINSTQLAKASDIDESVDDRSTKSTQAVADGLWYGTYKDKTNTIYNMCQSQGDAYVMADFWMTFLIKTDACNSTNKNNLKAIVKLPYSINSDKKVTIKKGGIFMWLTADEKEIDRKEKSPTGSGTLVVDSNGGTTMTLNMSDSGVWALTLDPSTTTPKTDIVKDFTKTAGQYKGRLEADVAGTDFSISSNGVLSGKIVSPLGALLSTNYTCDILSGKLEPGFKGYYLISKTPVKLSCTSLSTPTKTFTKTYVGWAVPIHATGNYDYGLRESVVGAQNAATIFFWLSDAETKEYVFGSDNLVLQ